MMTPQWSLLPRSLSKRREGAGGGSRGREQEEGAGGGSRGSVRSFLTASLALSARRISLQRPGPWPWEGGLLLPSSGGAGPYSLPLSISPMAFSASFDGFDSMLGSNLPH